MLFFGFGRIIRRKAYFLHKAGGVLLKRKTVSLFLIFALILCAFAETGLPSLSATAAQTDKWGDYEYTVTFRNEVVIKSYMGNDREVTIPSEIDGLPVTEIGDYSFNGFKRLVSPEEGFENHPNEKNNKRIRKVVIPSSVKTVGEHAFGNISRLKEVVFSEGLKTIEPFAFANCPKLEEIRLPESLVDFTLLAFEQTAVKEIVLGSNVKEPVLEDVEGSNVKRIICNAPEAHFGTVLLDNESVLEEIIMNGEFAGGNFVKSPVKRIVCIGGTSYIAALEMASCGYKFCSDKNGDSVVFSKSEADMPVTFEADGFRYYLNENSEAVISRYIGGKSNVTVPSSLEGHNVTAIAPLAFSSLRCASIHFPQGNDWLIDIGLLISVTLPDTVKTIGDFAFAYNVSLEEINIPDGVEEIPKQCFYGCGALENVILSESITELETGAFERCKSLESVEIQNVKKIGERAFFYCESLSEVRYSEKLKEIGAAAFSSCNLTETLDLSSVEKIGAGAFSDTKIKKAILNDNLEELGYGTFQSCKLLREINFPSKLVSIGDCCFRNAGISKAVFGGSLKEIGALAFNDCKELCIIELPESIEIIGNHAFENTLIELLVIPEKLSVIGYRAFGNCKKLETLRFNAVNCKVEEYMNESTELDIENLKESSPFYGCSIKEIFLGEGITSIGASSISYGTFENCSEVESVIIPDTVSKIGTAAFKNCSSLETAVIPDSVTEIADDAFAGCGNLTILCFKNSYAHSYAQAQGIRVSTFVVAPIPNQVYTGNAITPEVFVSFMGNPLHSRIDFSVSYANNVNAGEADVTVKGKGDYKNFSSKVKFTIVTKSISSATVAPIADRAYTGEAVTPSLTVTDGSKLLREGRDYSAAFFNNKKEGTATVKITGTGNYSGTLSAEFQIVKMSSGQNFFSRFISAASSLFIRIGALIADIFS